jgi:cytochrome c oxidase subunit 4
MSAHVLPKSIYYGIFGSLMVLTVLTVAAATVNLGSANFPIAIGIAITKATLVVLFFMHVKYSSRMTKMVVGVAIFFLLTMLGLTMTDYATRGWYAGPNGTALGGTSYTITHDGGTLRPSNEPTGARIPKEADAPVGSRLPAPENAPAK